MYYDPNTKKSTLFQPLDTKNNTAQPKTDNCSYLTISFLIVFHRLTVVQVPFCSLIKGITPKIRMLCFVLINSVLLNLLCVWILVQNASSHSCFTSMYSVLSRVTICGTGGCTLRLNNKQTTNKKRRSYPSRFSHTCCTDLFKLIGARKLHAHVARGTETTGTTDR